MVTFYIVDDEDMIREGMQFYFPWDQYGAEVVGSAVNGAAALSDILRKMPDVILTDVVMPKMDGIELARNLRQMGYTGEIIFLSAYQEMEYVKAAFKFAATDFLFKPIQTEEMDATIREAVSRVEKKFQRQALLADAQKTADALERSRQDVLWAAFLREPQTEGRELPASLGGAFGSFFPLLVHAPGLIASERREHLLRWESELPETISLLGVLPEGKRTDCLILGQVRDTPVPLAERVDILSQKLQRHLLPYDETVRVFHGEATDPHRLPDSYRAAQRAFAEYCIGGTEPLENCCKEAWGGKAVADLLLSGSEAATCQALQAFFRETTASGIPDPASLRSSCAIFCFTVCSSLEQIADGGLLAEFTSQAGQAAQAADFPDVYSGMRDALLRFKSRLSAEESNIRIILRIKALIAENPAEAGAASLAEEVHLSKNYLASLFKRHTGQTLNDYITSVRMETAAGLLRSGSCYIYEAASRVGYKDVPYFSKLFKQQYGCTPADYKERAELGAGV